MKSIAQLSLIVFLLSAILISCKNSNPKPTKSTKPLITYDLKELPEKSIIKLSDLGAIDIQYIPLETSEHSVIPRILGIIIGKNFFLTQSYTNINMFRYDGSFVTKIGIVGRGPNEFTVASCVGINPKNEIIYLVDGWQQKFLVYSNTGKFIKTFKYPLRAAVSFKFTEDGILCYNKNTMADINTSFILIDTVGQIITSYPNKYPWTSNVPTLAFDCENIFYKYGTHLIKKEIYCDTLYTFINKAFEPYSIIDISDDLCITTEARSELDGISIGQKYINPWKLFEFGDYIYYEFSAPIKGKAERFSFIGSKDGKFRVFIDPAKDLINDLDGGPNIYPVTTFDDRTVVAWIDAKNLKTNVNSETFKNFNPKYPKKKKELEILAESLKETDNPVLILIKFK